MTTTTAPRDAVPGEVRTDPLLRVRDLTVTFASRGRTSVRAVDGVDLDVAAGSTVGIVGESGSGKSVTSLAALGLLGRDVGRRPQHLAGLGQRHPLGGAGDAEVGDLDVAVGAEEDVLGLEVAVDDVERVEVVEREGDLGGVELGDRVGEALRDGRERPVERRR